MPPAANACHLALWLACLLATAAGIPFVRVDVDRPALAWAELEALLEAAGVMMV